MSEGKKNLIKISFSAFFAVLGWMGKIRWNLPQDAEGWLELLDMAVRFEKKWAKKTEINCEIEVYTKLF